MSGCCERMVDDMDVNGSGNSVEVTHGASVMNQTQDFSVGNQAPVFENESELYDNYKVCPLEVHYAPEVDIETMSNRQLAMSKLIFSQEFGELSFNQRVLHAALDESVPLLMRFQFCCIVASNLDEHFAKRLGAIPKFGADDDDAPDTQKMRATLRPRTEFEEHFAEAVRSVTRIQYKVLEKDILPKLKRHGLEFLRYRDLTEDQRDTMREYFRKKLFPLITPLSVDQTHPFPLLQSHGIYLVVVVLNPETSKTRRLYFRIPNVKPRALPVDETRLKYISVEHICLANIDMICEGMELLKAYPFRVTRNVKLEIDDTSFGDSDNLLDFVWEEVHRRRSAPATRLEVTKTMPADMRVLIQKELYLDEIDVYIIPSNLLGLADFFSVSFAPLPDLQYRPHEPSVPKRLIGLEEKLHEDPGKIFTVIRKGDLLVDYPTMSFNQSSLLFLRAAARDPKVQAIKCVLYRGGPDSPLVASLIRAAKSGKEVSVLVELKASFDEVQNSTYARQLQDAGCNVSYGLVGLKTHSKIMAVVRAEENGFRAYCQIATGNFNPSTAKIYTDLALFTCREDICLDVLDLFNALTGFSRKRRYRRLLVAPVNMLDSFIQMIDREAENARKGLAARIIVQINGLTEVDVVSHLYAASQAGVRIDIICRGLCAIRPGLPGKSENIRVFSWIGRFLQHRRIFYFHNNGDEHFFIGSADLRNRNLNGRVEVVVPIDDEKIRRKLYKMLIFFLTDRENTWEMASDGRYYFRKACAIPDPAPAPDLGSVLSIKDDEELVSKENDAIKISGWKNEWSVMIDGSSVVVNSVSYGCVPIRLKAGAVGDKEPEVLLVTPSKGSDDWNFPQGGEVEGESNRDSSKRHAEVNAGVTGRIIGSLGWFLSGKEKQHAIEVFILETKKELDWAEEFVRERQWFPLSDALTLSDDASNEILEKVLSTLSNWFQMSKRESSQKDDTSNNNSVHHENGLQTEIVDTMVDKNESASAEMSAVSAENESTDYRVEEMVNPVENGTGPATLLESPLKMKSSASSESLQGLSHILPNLEQHQQPSDST